MEQLKEEQFEKLHMVFGIAKDKDSSSILSTLPKEAHYYFTRASVERALEAQMLKVQAKISGLQGESFGTVSEAVKAAIENADKDDLIFIGGSAFVVADALPIFA